MMFPLISKYIFLDSANFQRTSLEDRCLGYIINVQYVIIHDKND